MVVWCGVGASSLGHGAHGAEDVGTKAELDRTCVALAGHRTGREGSGRGCRYSQQVGGPGPGPKGMG